MTIEDLEIAIREAKQMGLSRLPVSLFTLERLVEAAKSKTKPLTLEEQAREFQSRSRDVIRGLA